MHQSPRRLIIAIALAATATGARAQTLPLPSPTPPAGSALAVDGPGTFTTQTFPQLSGAAPSFYTGDGCEPTCCKSGMGLLPTIRESIFGKPDPNCWRPLPLSTLFSEGWNEPWVPSPSGSGGAPRQGWINAVDGNLYRLHFLSFAQGFNRSPDPTAYRFGYTLLTPLNRRLELITNIPFVLRNQVDGGKPIFEPFGQTATTAQSNTGFGDISVTPRLLLHETKDFSLTTELAVTIPTGTRPLAGNTTALTPAVGFWNNVAGGWVIRGGLGVFIPTQGSGNELISQFAIGQTITPHEMPIIGDFTYYLSTVVNTPLANSGLTRVTLTPGIRTHVGNDWYFLAGLPTPVTKERVADFGMIFWFMKAW
jgi:hypothetical protein